MKIKSLLLLGLMTLLSMNAFADVSYNKVDGIVYRFTFDSNHTNDKAEVLGVSVSVANTDNIIKNLTIPATVPDGNGISFPVKGFETSGRVWYEGTTYDYYDIAGVYQIKGIVGLVQTMTIDITNFTDQADLTGYIDPLTSGSNTMDLKIKGALKADYTVPGFARVKNLDVSELTGKNVIFGNGTLAYPGPQMVTIKATAAIVEASAFKNNEALQKFDGVKTVKENGFLHAKALTEAVLAEGATLGTSAFSYAGDPDSDGPTPSSFTKINMGVATEIGTQAFANTGITAINLAAAKKIGDQAFYKTKVTEVTIPAQVEEIANKAFYDITDLATVNINLDNDKATTIGTWFNESTITALTINAPKVTAIAASAFAASPIATLTLTDAKKVESIGADAFASYASDELDLSTLESLKTVDATSFKQGAYKKVYLKGTALDNENFVKAQTWIASPSCRSALEEITFPVALTEIGTFNDYTALKAVDLPDGLKTIKENAFERCTALEAIKIKSNVETIGKLAFEGCSKLASVDLVDASALTTIGESAFQNTALAAVDFAGATALETIGASAFANTKLTTVKIPATLTTLSNSVFANNTALATVDFSEATALEKITNKAFDGTALTTIDLDKCTKLTLVDDDAFPQNEYTLVKTSGTLLAGRTDPKDETSYYDNFSWPFNKDHIMKNAYNQADNTLKITVPDGLEKVADSQFEGWTALKGISLPKGVTEIGASAFAGSGLKTIAIGKKVATIGADAFNGSAVTSIDFSEAAALTTIKDGAFAHLVQLDGDGNPVSGLTEVAIPATVETIEQFAFLGCTLLANVDFSQASALTTIGTKAFDGTAIDELDLTGATALTTVANNAFPQNKYKKVLLAGTKLYTADPLYDGVSTPFSKDNILKGAKESLTKITFPEGYNLTAFDEFDYFTALNSVILPEGITEIPDNAFKGAKITSFKVPATITRIGKHAFDGSALTSVDFSEATALETIDNYAFANTPMTSVGLPKTLKVLNENVFEGSALESVKIKSHVESIEACAFRNASKLASVNFEDANALEKIKEEAFAGTALTVIDLSGATKLTLVDYNAFPQNVYTSVKLNGTALAGRDADGNYYDNFSYPFSKANIMKKAYNQDGALEMTLPAGLEKVEASQFKEWTALKEISLPKAVTLIDANAFQASGLTSFKIRENVKTIGNNAFEGCVDLATVTMSEAAALTTIGDFAFANCYFKDPVTEEETGLASIAIPAAVTTIGESAFANDALLATADFSLAAALTSIDENAFDGTALAVIDLSACTELATVYNSSFPKNNYTSILLNGTALTDLAPVKVWMSNWQTAAADDPTCKTTLKEITLPAKVTVIPNDFLAGFVGVTEVSLPRECTTIESNAFAGSGLTGIKIRSKVQSIGSGAFVNCENLATANFAEATALTSIGANAFKNTAVKEVIIPANADDKPLLIGEAAFKNSKLKSFSAKSWAGSAIVTVSGVDQADGILAANLFENTKLSGITIPATISEIGEEAFADCKKLELVNFKHAKKAEKMTSIGKYAFRNCESLESLDLSNTKLPSITSKYPFEGCTALATIVFPEEFVTINNGDALFADCPIENFEAPNLTSTSGVLFGMYSTFDDETGVRTGYELRDADNANTTLKTVKMGGNIPSNCFAYCTALEEVEWIGENATTGVYFTVAANAFDHCTGLQTFTFMPETNNINSLLVNDNAFVGCVPFVLFDTNSNYLDYINYAHDGAAPINTTFGENEISTVKTVQDKANAKQFVAKFVNTSNTPMSIDAAEAKVYSIYVDGDAAYFHALRTFEGKYYLQPGDHVIIKTEEAKEVAINRESRRYLATYTDARISVAYDDVYDSKEGDDLAKVQAGANVKAGTYLYRLTNTTSIGFGFTFFTGTTIKAGQFFVACGKKPDGAGRLSMVWLDENGNVESETTGIETVESNDVNNGDVFNMQGVRVNKAQKGIYIQNGKKIVVK